MGLALGLLVAAGLAAPGFASAAPAPAPADEELSVQAALDSAPSVGESATLTYTVSAAAASDGVQISAELPPNLRWRTAPAGTAVSDRLSSAPQSKGTLHRAEITRSLAVGEAARFTGTVTAVAPGPAEIQVRAQADRSYGVAAGADDVLATIAPAGQPSRLGIVTSSRAAAVPYDGPAPEVPEAPVKALAAQEPPPAGREVPEPSDRAGEPASERTGEPAAVAATSCVTGSWNYADKFGIGRAARMWRVEAWDDDSVTGSANDFLAAGQTGFDGRYTLCFNSSDAGGSGTQDVFLVFIADNGAWRVQGPGGTYWYGSGVLWNVPSNSTREVGWLQPGDPTHHRGAAAFQAVSDAWNGTPGACWDMVSACRAVVVNWAPGSTTGNSYNPDSNQISLKASAPDWPHTVVHETAHSIMDDVYNDQMPSAPNCNPHFIKKVSSAGCAWVEGFADWLPTRIYNDHSYRGSTGTVNLETPTWDTPGWDNFDRVEGRVAGALMDLNDSTNDGFDVVSEGMDAIWLTFQWHNSSTFHQFWNQRAGDGFNVGQTARSTLHQNTIDY
ncbi:hypothetical protein WEI85_44320 [Actinomycetes bacterium KLBMP 9797]